MVVKASVTTIAAFAGTESRQSFAGQPKIALKNLAILPGGFGWGTGGMAGASDIVPLDLDFQKFGWPGFGGVQPLGCRSTLKREL